MYAMLLYPLGPTYLGTWSYTEGVARELGSGRRHIWREKLNFKFDIYLYLCRNLIVYIKPNVFVY